LDLLKAGANGRLEKLPHGEFRSLNRLAAVPAAPTTVRGGITGEAEEVALHELHY
jgi:hypothetical protein